MQLKTAIKTISPSQAESLLEKNTYKGQRIKKQSHVDQLASKMEDGRFHVGNVALVYRDKETLLADGQHQLSACVKSGKPFKAVVQEYTLNGESDEEIARIFSQFNVDKTRTRSDIAWIYACQIGWEHWPRHCVTVCTSALAILASGDYARNNPLSFDDNAVLLSENKKVCEWIREMLYDGESWKHGKHLRRGPVVAAMMASWRKSQSAAREFWSQVRDGEMLNAQSPAYKIREWLKENAVSGGNTGRAQKQASGHEFYCRSITAWNAYRVGEKTSLKYFPKSTPKAR